MACDESKFNDRAYDIVFLLIDSRHAGSFLFRNATLFAIPSMV